VTKSTKQELAYSHEYQKRADVRARQVKRVQAQRAAIKAGTNKIGDGKDIDHIKPLIAGGGNTPGNTRNTDTKTNRGWRKGQSGYDPSKQKK
jgi:hypothetical protein